MKRPPGKLKEEFGQAGWGIKEAVKDKCVLCGSKNFKRLFSVEGKKIVRCGRCGLVRTESFSEPDYKKYHRDQEYQKFETHFRNIFLKRVQIVEKFFPEHGKVLEIGCSVGLLLSLLKEKGWEVWGVEPSKSAYVAGKKGIKIVNEVFEKATLPNSYFDLIILNHTLEHLNNPLEILRKARPLLRKGGKIFVDVPNFASLSSGLLGQRWPYLAPSEHLHHFEPKTLKKLIKKAGFKVIFESSHSGIFDLGSPVKGLYDELLSRPRSFVKYLITAPWAYLTTLMGRGISLTVVGEK